MNDELNNGSPQPQEPVTNPEVNTAPTETVTEQPTFKVKYNHEEKELSYDEAITYAQKGMNYDKTLERNQQLEKDYQVAKKYGSEWGVYSVQDIIDQYGNQGISTLDDFEKAVERQKYINQGIDPNVLDEAINNNPVVKEASALLERQRQQNYFNEQVKALEAYSPGIDLSSLDPSITEDFQKGKPLVDAYIKWENAKYKAELEAFKKGSQTQDTNKINAETATGSLQPGNMPKDFISKNDFEANKGNQKWLSDNYDLLKKSMNKWK